MPDVTAAQDKALRTARVLIDIGHSRDDVLSNPAIPVDLREWVAEQLGEETVRTFERARVISTAEDPNDWLSSVDRSDWYYWKTLRTFLLGVKGWSRDTVTSLDDASDRILRQLKPPSTPEFDVRGLVLGYVQSGKTANFTAVIAKAADAGYRLVVVFSGTDNGLRKQTQIRLNRELTGYAHNPSGAVRMPPVGRQWHQYTTDDLNGDFNPGRANHAALQGSQPVLLVVKKNGPVLRKLKAWFMSAPDDVRSTLPALFIDDEADQASVDSRGSYQTEDTYDPEDPDYESPAAINGLIRELMLLFSKRAYVGYTATPFANILIPHDGYDPVAGQDLYPKDFFIELPKPRGYFGTEEFFGRFDPRNDERVEGLDVLRIVPPEQIAALIQNYELTSSLDEAIAAFILGGAARGLRGKADAPCTMLVHTSQRIADQSPTKQLVESRFREVKDEWRYDRSGGIRTRLQKLWEADFVATSATEQRPVHRFDEVEPFIGPFLEAVQVREINSERGDVLDYDLEPGLKAIAVGGNKLSRGLTLEGLLVSYFARRSPQYDTLLQMARWYGYRAGYEDLTRIYTTGELAGWFADLALVEHRLRQDMQVYEQTPGLTPRDVGMRILQHPVMQVTSSLKRRQTRVTRTSQSYSGSLEQTFKFPMRDENALALLCERNRIAVQEFLGSLGSATEQTKFGPLWNGVSASGVVDLLRAFDVHPEAAGLNPALMAAWVEQQNAAGEVVDWTVVVRGRDQQNATLGQATWVPGNEPVWNMSRTRIKGSNSLGVVTTHGDEAFGLTDAERQAMDRLLAEGGETDANRAARLSRSARSALLLLYPISKYSGRDGTALGKAREPLYDDAGLAAGRDLIGLAVSFPRTSQNRPTEAHIEGTAPWRPVL